MVKDSAAKAILAGVAGGMALNGMMRLLIGLELILWATIAVAEAYAIAWVFVVSRSKLIGGEA